MSKNEKKSVAKKAIQAYYLSRMGWLSIAILAIIQKWNALGLTLSQVILLQGIFSLGIISFEIPTGTFSDVGKRKHVMMASNVLIIMGLYTYWKAQEYCWLIIAELIFALGGALMSGTNTALVYEALLEENREKEVSRIYSTGSTISFSIYTIAFIVGGFIAKVSQDYAFIIAISLYALTMTGFARVIEPQRKQAKSMNQAISSSLRSIRTQPLLLGYVATFTMVSLVGRIYFWVFQLQLPSYLELQYVGTATALMGIIGAIGGFWAPKAEPKNTLLIQLIMLYLFATLLYQVSQSLFILFVSWMLLEWTRGGAIPLYSARIQDLLESSERATVGSIVSTVASLTYSFVSIGIGIFELPFVWIIRLTFASGLALGVSAIISITVTQCSEHETYEL